MKSVGAVSGTRGNATARVNSMHDRTSVNANQKLHCGCITRSSERYIVIHDVQGGYSPGKYSVFMV